MTSSDRRQFLQGAAAGAAAFAFRPALDGLGRLAPGSAPIDVGVVGAGRQGRAILAELQKLEQVRIVAVCDTLAGRLRSGARRAGRDARPFDDHRKMLDEQPLAAVFVATSTDAHVQAVVDSLAGGKHVYCEAPLAANIEDAKAIVHAARDAATVFQAGLLARSNPIYKLAWSFQRAGVLETMIEGRAQDHEKTSWRFPADDAEIREALNWRLHPERSAGLPGELGTHQFDVVDWFLGEYPVAVRGGGAIRLYDDGRELADTVRCTLRYADGLEVGWSGSLCTSYEGRYELLAGSMGSIRLAWNAGWLFKEADSPTQGWEVYANRESFHDDEGITLIADATKLAKQGKLKEGVGLPDPPLYYALVDFVKSVTEGAEVVCTAEEGLRGTAIGLAAQRAVRSGEEIAIEPKDLQAD